MRNRIYFFTGTGNSLKAAQTIAEALPGCELSAICKDASLDAPENCERIGFVFPDYAGGPPKMVADFINSIKLPSQRDTYLFAVSTFGGNVGSVTALTGALLKAREWRLDYGANIWSYPNAVALYPMIKGAGLFAKMSERRAKRIAKDVAAKRRVNIPDAKASAQKRYEGFMAQIPSSDSGYHVNDDCISCEICRKVCPAKNITMSNGKPEFCHQCEGCMACIQHCPKRAINCLDKTQKRGRYTHPGVGHHMIAKHYGH
jgi:ferredoxin